MKESGEIRKRKRVEIMELGEKNHICILFFLQTFITNYLRHVKKPGRNFK
jgi:hypothetical protein